MMYRQTLENNCNRLLNLYNLDPGAQYRGLGDRIYWAWKTVDFANATMQGGVHALAAMSRLGLLDPAWSQELIDDIIRATPKVIRSNGSVEEAYPQENSFCVTALVAFDILCAVDLLSERLKDSIKQEYLAIVEPLIRFISKHGEEHAIISNHLATGVAAMVLWNKLSGEQSQRHEELLAIIYEHQSEEGWYKEYEGADPGYQTLCTYYLASAWLNTRDEKLKKSLAASARFLRHLMHPDGSIGGLYGSRNTEVYYPGGIVALSHYIEDFAYIEVALAEGYKHQTHLLPQDIDVNNYIPLLNAYAFAAYHAQNVEVGHPKPFFAQANEKLFAEAGLFLKSTTSYFCIINFKKGGAIKVFDLDRGQLDAEDGGLFGRLNSGQRFSTQQFDEQTAWNDGTFSSGFYKINESYPGPFQTVILRILAMTFFKSVFLGNVFKKLIVKMLMTGKNKLKGGVQTKLLFQEGQIQLVQTVNAPNSTAELGHIGKAKATHMASSGYFLSSHLNLHANSTRLVFKSNTAS